MPKDNIDDRYLEMTTKIVVATVSSGNAGPSALADPDGVAKLISTVAQQLVKMRTGEY